MLTWNDIGAFALVGCIVLFFLFLGSRWGQGFLVILISIPVLIFAFLFLVVVRWVLPPEAFGYLTKSWRRFLGPPKTVLAS